MTFTLRAATAANREWLWQTKTRCFRTYVEQTWGTWDEAVQRARFDGNFDSAEFQIIAVDGRDAGYLSFRRGEQEVQLFNLMLVPEFQNQGLGTAVMQDLLAAARSSRVPVRLQVLKVTPARRLYERLGFAVTEETSTHFRMLWKAG